MAIVSYIETAFGNPGYVVAFYAVAINIAAYLAFAWDKYCARRQMWRVQEQTLLMLAAVGGTLGALIGQQTLRHKTRKEPFRTYFHAIIVMQIIGFVALSFPQVRSAVWTLILAIG